MRFLPIVALLLGASPALACGPDTDCVLGDRHYRIAMPAGHDGATAVPAIVFSHGYRGSAQGVMRNGSLRRMVSDLGAALIAVKSKDDDWVIPNAPRHMDSDGAEEFRYFDAVLDDASRRFAIDESRIMATGFSAGGMMVWNLACSRSDRFAAFAPISGTFWLRPPASCAGPVANLIHIHGDSDSTVPLSGRRILETKQGEVREALDMYVRYGGFGPPRPARHSGLRCEERRNKTGDILDFCLFEGGHSFRTEYVRFAFEKFRQAGRL
ncbi:prolyl oligopeptidase family serine peptidase [Roseobacter sp. YSTF-M11]|uniref:Prolyl oligopeptidase family serine peptidase n=1 Tax=Roseobacter insulae TaxID=2859783 RepID=A0A9X1FXA5_9RHOB|nr:prolyl oligopeptidase family serine peptidase [Roseobacter insulae]MBW4709805.1 prolyl oligopeptidase family serine peptidase [Roseobacter insulae]